MNIAMVISRAVHLATCLLIFGMDAFAILILPTALNSTSRCDWRRRQRIGMRLVIPLLVLSGAAWFLLVTIGMIDLPLTAAGLRLVWTRTHFGRLWQLRTVLAFVTIALQLSAGGTRLRIISLLASGALLASLAWSGHGQLSAWPGIHLANDGIHLLVAGLWPTGLVPLALILGQRITSHADATAIATRFSRMSVVCVCLLVLSGLVNTLLTLQHPGDLFFTEYGAVLLGKIAAVGLMIVLGAFNRRDVRHATLKTVRCRVLIEAGIAIAVVAATAWLGTLEP